MSHKLVWTEGLFVTQHHFQRLDRYHERLLADRMRLAMAYDWGVIDLAIDERALAAGQLRVSRLTAVMPGGAILTGGGGDAQQLAIPPRPFDSEFTPQMASLDVHVAMAQEVDGMPSVALEPALASVTRYTRSQESLPDVNTGTAPLPVDVARPNVRILFGDERRDGFDTIRIAQLTRAASGAVMLKETHVPPVLRIAASPYLNRGFRAILTAMTARQRALADSRRQRSASM